MNETLETVLKAGALGVLALVLVGAFVILKLSIGTGKEFLAGVLDVMRSTGDRLVGGVEKLATNVEHLSERVDQLETRTKDDHAVIAEKITALVERSESDPFERATPERGVRRG